jgi:Ca-activated chloride channel homolog
MVRGRFHLSAFALGILSLAGSTFSQDTIDDAVRIRTRVVFVDTLVKDKRTGENVTDLTRDDFEILDNGKPRPISYFSRESDDRKRPLALLLILAPMDDGARKSFQRPEIVNSITVALNKLPPEDEVAVMLLWRDGITRMLTGLTRDRAKVTAVLASLPKYTQTKPVARASRIIQDAALSTAAERPNSKITVVMAADSVFLMTHAERDELDRNLIRAGVSFNAVITGSDKFFTLFSPLLKPMENDASWYDVPQYIASRTGGDYVRTRKPKEYGSALERLIGNLTARYSLGFALTENETDDGQMHRLEVNVRARDSRGKNRTLQVRARQGYYSPKSG